MSAPLAPLSEESSIPTDLQQRYSNWKKNTKLLYDYLNTYTAKWPSLTCQFFPDVDTTSDTHRVLLSYFTSTQIPEDESVYIGTFSTAKHLNWSSLNNFDIDEMEFKPENSTKFPKKTLTTDITIPFPNGDCNRARYLPQNPDLIAAASSDGSIYIFNRTKHGSHRLRQTQDSQPPYQARMYAGDNKVEDFTNSNEALSINWNLQREGLLASSYSNGSVKVWDMKKYSSINPTITSTVFDTNLDEAGANNVAWMSSHDSLFAACGESNKLSLFDHRKGTTEVNKISDEFHSGGINACQFNHSNNLLLASADSNGVINLWDVRKLDKEPILNFNHGSSISTIEWNPNHETILATAGQDDGIIKLWDTSKGESIFVHGGHMLGVNDMSWNAHDPWLMCSVSNDNSIHVWRPACHLVETA